MLIGKDQFAKALAQATNMSDDELRLATNSRSARSYYVIDKGRTFSLKAILRLAYKMEGFLGAHDIPQSSKVARALRPNFNIVHITKKTEKKRLERQRKNAERWERDPKFRVDVLDFYGSTCAISGCTVLDAIDAAHLTGVGQNGKDERENSIVFRADLHRLFDAEPVQMAINPKTMTVHFATECRAYYEKYEGVEVKIPKGGPKATAFSLHWNSFRKAHKQQKLSV